MKKVIIVILCLISSLANAQDTFTWENIPVFETLPSFAPSFSQTVNGVTATASASFGNLVAMNANGFSGTSGIILSEFTNNNGFIVSFSAPVNVGSIYIANADGSKLGTITITPEGCNSLVYTYIETDGINTGHNHSVNWSGITSFTIQNSNPNAALNLDNITFALNDPLTTSITTQANVSCNGGTNGAIDLAVSGGTSSYTYAWSNGATTQDISSLSAGTYNVTVTDANGCTATASVTITEPVAIDVTTAVTNVSCNNGSNGTIDLTASGGTGTLTFDWGGGVTTEDRTGLSAGDYDITITDANGCTATASVTITEPSAISATTAVTNVSCNNGSNGTIDLTASGGTGTLTFDWGGGVTTEDRTGLSAGDYDITVTDANGCTATASVTITEPSAISATTAVTNVSCNNGSNGTIDLTASGGTGTLTFDWGGGVTTEDRTGLSAGDYDITVTDANGCTATASVTITEPVAIDVTTAVTNVSCNNGSNGTIDLTASGGTGTLTFDWGGGVTTEDRTGLSAGDYDVTVTDANGCTATASVTITEPAAIDVTTAVTNVSCNNGSNGTIDLTASGGTGTLTFDWGGGVTMEDRTGLSAGDYDITITDANGCTATASVTITEPAAIDVSTSTDGTTITATATGMTYQWLDCDANVPVTGATAQSFTPAVNGNYAVIVDNGDCADTSACVAITTLGINNFSKQQWNIYPNPSSGEVKVSFEGKVATLTIIDPAGRLVWSGEIQQNETISINKYQTGVYFFVLKTETQTGIKRVVKE